MFKFLKEKIGSWVKNISKEKEEKIIEIKEKPAKPEKEKLKTKEKKKKTSKELKEERQITDKVIEDIKKERGEDIRPIPRQEEIEEELKRIEDERKTESEEEKPGTKSFFEKIKSKITKIKITEEDFKTYSEELEMLLLENNVALEVAENIISQLRNKIVGKEILKKELEGEIKDSLKDIIRNILAEPFDLLVKIKDKNHEKKEPYVILFCGVNGTGKTTTIAKIANLLNEKKISCVIAAGDTFRAASIEQIKKHGDKLGIKVISSEYGADPASVGFDAINYARKNSIKCVLIDTAGRMHTAKNLLKEIEKISKVCKPDTKIFVGESITGNDIIEQVKEFDSMIGIDGIILTKADIDEKGGTALSVGQITKKPILYLGIGQEYKQIEPFDKNKFVERLGL